MAATATAPNGNRQQQNGGGEFEELLNRPAAMDRDLAMMRMENETIMSECRMRPRDMGSIRGQLSSLLAEFPEFADEAIYYKPVGKEEGSNQQKYASGLSIRSAEALAEVYGYNRIRADVTPIDDGKVKLEATFTDFQTGRIWQDGGIVSRYYTKRGGGRVAHSDDRFYNVVLKAEKSKYLREVILRSVNSALKAWFEAECRRVAESRMDDKAVAKTLEGFRAIGVSKEQVEEAVGRPIAMGWTNSDRLMLRGIYQAIKDGESTIEEAFGRKEPPKPQPRGPVKGSDLTAPKSAPPAETHDLPQSTSDIDESLVARARESFGVAQDEQGVQFEHDAMASLEMNDKTREEIAKLAHSRREAIREAQSPQPAKRQKSLT